MNIKKSAIAALLAAPATLAFSAPAQAQTIAYANPTSVIGTSKAFAAANQQIGTTYKASFDQIAQRRQALQKELEPLLTALDTNKDKTVSEAEIQAATTAKRPELDKIRTAQTAAEQEVARLSTPASRAELFAIESILRQYEAAQLRVVTARKISVVLNPEVIMYAPESADITSAIVAELDKTLPTVGIAPPEGWQPSRETVQIQQQLVQLAQLRAYQAQAAQQQAGAAAPAGTAPRPAAKPAEPR